MRFSHSGDLGDIVYSLPFVLSLSRKAEICLTPAPYTDTPMTTERAQFLAPLLGEQHYVKSVEFGGDRIECNLDVFRNVVFQDTSRTLAQCYFAAFNVPPNPDVYNRAWLTVRRPVKSHDIIVSRTPRYRCEAFPWRDILEHYAGRSVGFVGLRSEHEEFCGTVRDVPFVETGTALDLARVIAGAELFIGNQGFCYSVAEGMKQRCIQERSQAMPNCTYPRVNAQHFPGSFQGFPVLNRVAA